VASLVLSSGKTKALIFSSAISCIVSLPITVVLAPTMNVGAAVLGYLVYMSIQIGFFYVYYIPKVLKLSSWKILATSFAPALMVGLLSFGGAYGLQKWLGLGNSEWVKMILNSGIFSLIFLAVAGVFLIRPGEKQLLNAYLQRFTRRAN